MKWAELRPDENANGLKRRIVPIRELAKYMNRIDVKAYVIPINFVRKTARYIPHIFTKNELHSFFSATDKVKYNRLCPTRHFVISVIFRVIYCCALRPSEALTLKTSNVDLRDGRLIIKDSKGYKDRIVAFSEELLILCKKYHEKVHLMIPESEYFFPNPQGKAYSPSHLYRLFFYCWKLAGISNFCGSPPRVYDLRHSAVTNCLYRWMKEGKNINAYLPYLSAFLGHASFSETAYYIHLVPEFFPQMSEINMERFSDLIPEVIK
jgi:integrase